MTIDAARVSRSGNIALYPSLCPTPEGGVACAWYEHSAPDKPAPSRVFAAVSPDWRRFGAPACVSGNESYNNGPSLALLGRMYVAAWHSWRAPGKPPFTPDGDVTNIWIAHSPDACAWSPPALLLERPANTEYACLAACGERAALLLRSRNDGRLYLTEVDGRGCARPAVALPDAFRHARYPDLAAVPGGGLCLVYVDPATTSVMIAFAGPDGVWGGPKPLEPAGQRVCRPKVSFRGQETWVAWHDDNWGSRLARYRVRVGDAPLVVALDGDGTPGNAFWTLNGLRLIPEEGQGRELALAFGPEDFPPPAGYARIASGNALYDPQRGYGFDAGVQTLLRELGDDLTRALAMAGAPREFTVRAAPGVYRLECVYSSWISSRPGTRIVVKGEVLEAEATESRTDAVTVCRLHGDAVLERHRIAGAFDANRPSKVVFHPRTEAPHLAWTSYGPESIRILFGALGQASRIS